METPSSTRRVTRSQAKAAASANTFTTNNIPISKMRLEESEKKKGMKCGQRNDTQQQERGALLDITNDSPIIGLAMGGSAISTSSAMVSKKRVMTVKTTSPGSGEALLRGQVKNLLQKVEEDESHFVSIKQVSMANNNNRPFLHLLQSPMHLFLAPTPANTPHLNPPDNMLPSVTPTPVEDKLTISQLNGEDESKVTRSLLLEFSEKSEGYDSSSVVTNETVVTTTGGGGEDDVSSSVWSVQAIAASVGDEGSEEEEEEGWVEELCQGMSKICFNTSSNYNGGNRFIAAAAGKHTRFLYNSDGEIEGVEEEEVQPNALLLKGLPQPNGKHLRFSDDEEEEE
ncbi:unnamed protein product [Cuscuta epithymum]|uniref:Uncharacterized protein n=1 Tax=Cuscuta epithymum TaxID=186058 RepID=A0AAV0FDA7_9ASTE|nr:unnamed protein product [Cuscuta epithymum]